MLLNNAFKANLELWYGNRMLRERKLYAIFIHYRHFVKIGTNSLRIVYPAVDWSVGTSQIKTNSQKLMLFCFSYFSAFIKMILLQGLDCPLSTCFPVSLAPEIECKQIKPLHLTINNPLLETDCHQNKLEEDCFAVVVVVVLLPHLW